MKKRIKLNESKLKSVITRVIKEEFSDATTFNKSFEPCGRGGQLQEEKHLNKLTESDLHRIVKESVRKMLKENTANVESQFADIITGLDAQSASFIAGELARTGQETIGAMTFIIEHFNGYGYGGPDVNGNYDY